MKTMITTVTERGQVSIPADVRKRMRLEPGRRLVWEAVSDSECRVRVSPDVRAAGATAMLGYARRFRDVRRTADWMVELREGDV
jgi:AbrB family looped-hinge helix DNA binding protein